MDTVDRIERSRQVTDHYRSLTDDELIAIAGQRSDLTDIAQQALDAEVLRRKLEIPAAEPEENPVELPDSEPAFDSPYAEDRQLVALETVFSLRDAQQLEALLNEHGIPFYMGEERATRARKNFIPQDDPELRDWKDRDQEQPLKPAGIFCPRCRAEKVVLDGSQPAPPTPGQVTRFMWRCEVCGKRWEDDGVFAEE
jgi:hypothetical protein